MKQSYYVRAKWDQEASVWVSETDIPGLVIEADTLQEFEELMNELAPEMLAANEHLHNERVSVDFRFEGRREFAVA
jgi:predicted RNase H-like HicB family nuclease